MSLDETSRGSLTPITAGMARAMVKDGRVARTCEGCGLLIPVYVGRYPETCPKCGGHLVAAETGRASMEARKKRRVAESLDPGVACVSDVPRIQKLIEAGVISDLAHGGDPFCSRARTITLESLEKVLPGGSKGLGWFVERAENGRFYRVERPKDPVLVFEFVEGTGNLIIFATRSPSTWLGFDPRAELVAEDFTVFDGMDETVKLLPSSTSRYLLSTEDGAGVYRAFDNGASQWDVWFSVHNLAPVCIARALPTIDDAKNAAENHLKYVAGVPAAGSAPSADASGKKVELNINVGEAGGAIVKNGQPTGPTQGDGATRAHGGFRFEIGHNAKPNVRTDVERSIQNRINSKRGLASRVKAAKKWHKSAEGSRMHKDLGRFNRGNHRGQDEARGPLDVTTMPTGAKVCDIGNHRSPHGVWFGYCVEHPHKSWARCAEHGGSAAVWKAGTAHIRAAHSDEGSTATAGVGVGDETAGGGVWMEGTHLERISEDYGDNSSGTIRPTTIPGVTDRNVDDIFQSLLRKLIVIESLDVLQDVDFTDQGGIFLMFDPSLSSAEMQEILNVLREGNDQLRMVSAPDGSMGEAAEWWVLELPPPAEQQALPPAGNPFAAKEPEAKPGDNEPPRQQMVAQTGTDLDKLAMSLDLDAALKSIGKKRK